MGCASSGARALCKGQGVENDKLSNPKSAMMHYPDTKSAVAGITRSGSDIINTIHDPRVSHDEPDDTSTMIKNGFDNIKHDAFEAMDNFEEKVEDAVKTEADDLIKQTTAAADEVTDKIEDEITKAAESVMNKVEQLKVDSLETESETKQDVDKKIDDLLATMEASP